MVTKHEPITWVWVQSLQWSTGAGGVFALKLKAFCPFSHKRGAKVKDLCDSSLINLLTVMISPYFWSIGQGSHPVRPCLSRNVRYRNKHIKSTDMLKMLMKYSSRISFLMLEKLQHVKLAQRKIEHPLNIDANCSSGSTVSTLHTTYQHC